MCHLFVGLECDVLGSNAASQLQGPGFDPKLKLLSVWYFWLFSQGLYGFSLGSLVYP